MPGTDEIEKLPFEESRERIINILTKHYTEGGLELEEFEKRLDLANMSQDVDSLVPLVTDLSPLPRSGRSAQSPSRHSANSYPMMNEGPVKENSFLFSFMSGIARKGSWRPPKRLTSVTFMGAMELDLREALLPPGRSTINVFSVMGGVEILVPPGVNVEVQGIGIMGSFEDKSSDIPHEGAPTLEINGFAFMAGVEVKEKKSKQWDRD